VLKIKEKERIEREKREERENGGRFQKSKKRRQTSFDSIREEF
jgi:hypothetical protein